MPLLCALLHLVYSYIMVPLLFRRRSPALKSSVKALQSFLSSPSSMSFYLSSSLSISLICYRSFSSDLLCLPLVLGLCTIYKYIVSSVPIWLYVSPHGNCVRKFVARCNKVNFFFSFPSLFFIGMS